MSGASVERKESRNGDKFFEVLKQYWGYDGFRPRQEEVVRSLAAGRDVCVVMPTGGGKSLCYQLPAVLEEKRTAVVISPLIALMQDQVAQLRQMGIPAVFLNSAVVEADRSEIKRKATAGEYRLMYISPERAVMESTAAWLKKVPVSFFAIDEAHCISQWGHDFRPEYRQLSRLRELFPDRPIAAFTASATQRVRHDIVEQLRLRDSFNSISSFHRQNLRYITRECPGGEQDECLLRAVRRVKDGNVIVYTPTVARVGEVVDLLAENGIAATGYHAQMSSRERRENQEKWMTEEVRVLVGTIAFGLGINKPNVRAVVRLGLPDSIELLYQETGRAGRDQLPADCYLFWQKRDIPLQRYFLTRIGSEQEREKARSRFRDMMNFVDSHSCRPKIICEHFGESPKWESCNVCDACGGMPDWLALGDRSYKKHRRSHRHADRHYVAREAQAVVVNRAAGENDSPLNQELRALLAEWRRTLAREKVTPAFVVMHDATLDALCQARPKSIAELRRISGMGVKKCEMYGEEILEVFRRFGRGERASKEWRARPSTPSLETKELVEKGHSFEEIAQIRGRKVWSVKAMVADLIEKGEIRFRPQWVDVERYKEIEEASKRLGMDLVKPIVDALTGGTSYEDVRLVVADLRWKKKQEGKAA